MKIVQLVCENGLGHFKRSIGLLSALSKKQPKLNITLLCKSWQLERLKDWEPLKKLQNEGLSTLTDIFPPNIKWALDPEIYKDGRLLNWKHVLKNIPEVQQADLVISDNLVGILEVRKDALLVGSFLWMEIFEHAFGTAPSIRAFIEDDQRLLKTHKPFMLGIDMVAMPGLKKWTRHIPMPWFGQAPKFPPKPKRKLHRITVLGGATSLAQQQAKKIIQVILAHTNFQLVLPQRMIEDFKINAKERISIFDFGLEDYYQCDLVICRPGIGTLTDCIVTNTPMLLFSEGNNLEMEYNAKQLEQNGLAINLPFEFEPEDLTKKIEYIFSPENYEAFSNRLIATPTNGFDQAASWIIDHYL